MFVEHLSDGRVKYGMYYEYYLTGKKRRATITYDKDTKNRVVLYDYPIPLTVKKKDNDNNDANDVDAKLYSGKIWDKEEFYIPV